MTDPATLIEEVAKRIASTAFEPTSGYGHADFAEDDALDRQAAREEASNFLEAAYDVIVASVERERDEAEEKLTTLRTVTLARVCEERDKALDRATQFDAAAKRSMEAAGELARKLDEALDRAETAEAKLIEAAAAMERGGVNGGCFTSSQECASYLRSLIAEVER